MKTAGKRHSAKAEVFAFYAEHTDVESDYVMAPRELQALEFIGDTMGMY